MDLDSGLDFRIEDDDAVAPSGAAMPKSPMETLTGAHTEIRQAAQSSSASLMAALEGAGAKAAARGAEPTPPVLPTLDFHLDDEEKPAPMRGAPGREAAPGRASAPVPSLAQPQAAIDLDKLDLTFDAEQVTFEDPTPSVLDGQWHDAATKLDLAKAYQEMGDVEGAREILQEVLHEGDDDQKTEAQSLLARLG
jgi:FimV-like protein